MSKSHQNSLTIVGLAMFLFVSIFALIMNTNIMMTVQNTFSEQELGKLVHDEVRRVLDRYDETSTFKEVQKKLYNVETTSPESFFSETIPSDTVPYLLQKNFTPSYVLGNGIDERVSFVIGIPSVKRSGLSYLYDTLQSIFTNIYPSNEHSVTVVVMLAETDENFVENEAKKIFSTFTRQVRNGLLQVVSPNPSVYPDFDAIPLSFGDPQNRVKWRSKEVYDAAYLMLYCRNKADYYLMLEDDVIASKGYIAAIKKFVADHQNDDYLYFSFCNFNSIGKLFREADIPVWATYFLTFYGFKPIDWLMDDFAHIKYCNPEMSSDACRKLKSEKKPHHHPALFQHIGKRSSLDGKTQNLVDRHFSASPVIANVYHNPDAKITSTLEAIDSNLEKWYADSGGMNWHYYVAPASANQLVTIDFEKEEKISKVLVKTGDKDGSNRLIYKAAALEILANDMPFKGFEKCAVFDHNGEAECTFKNRNIKKIRIRILKNLISNTLFDFIYIA